MGVTMLNAVATFRKAGGGSAVGVSTPTFNGPFVVPAKSAQAGNDAGTNAITGSPQTLDPKKAGSTTFGQTDGVFSYGFLPDNYNNTLGSASFGVYNLPIFADADAANFSAGPLTQNTFQGGPPAYPNVNDGNHAPGFTGFPQGFTIFDLAPGIGNYNLTDNVPAANTASYSASAVATLGTAAALPSFATPTFTEDGLGGGSVGLVVPAGVTETQVYIQDLKTGHNYTLVTNSASAVTLQLPDTLGTAVPGSKPVPTIPANDPYQIIAVGFDYPAFEAAPPASSSLTPTIVGSNGQADITVSMPLSFAGYGTGASVGRLPQHR